MHQIFISTSYVPSSFLVTGSPERKHPDAYIPGLRSDATKATAFDLVPCKTLWGIPYGEASGLWANSPRETGRCYSLIWIYMPHHPFPL